MFYRTISTQLAVIVEKYNKMAFVSGPRQVGKTTLAKEYSKRFLQSTYFNWDVITDQKRLLKDPYFFEKENRDTQSRFLVILDEIHKYARWKNYLKGAYDRYYDEFCFVVTGSGRLDFFKKGGDSLMGRYMSLPIFPLTVGELSGQLHTWEDFKSLLNEPPPARPGTRDAYLSLFQYSGFPEPFYREEKSFYNLWFQERKSLLIRDDIRNTSNIREISLLEMLSHLIPERVGSPLSVNSLREDIGVAFETVRDWLLILERFYYMFRLTPFAGSLSRTLKKEPKVYLYDWVETPDEGLRFENMAALHLYKAVQTWRAMGAGDIQLFYIRDKEKREVDFVITEKNRPFCLIECKMSDEKPAHSLTYFQDKLNIPVSVQLIHNGGVSKKIRSNGKTIWIISADRWLSMLP